MVDEDTPISIPIEERLASPEISVFDKLVELIQSSRTIGFPKRDLDRIYKFWHGIEDFSNRVVRMSKSLNLRGIPEAEIKHAKEYLDDLVEVTEQITKLMRAFEKKDIEECSWKEDGKPIALAIRVYEERDDLGFYEDSITALFEAISKVTLERQLPEDEIRQKIAQHAIEELWSTFDYARLYWAADADAEASTIDEIEEEKDEFLAALKGNLWTEEEEKIQKRKIKGLKVVIEEIDDGEVSDNIKLVWKAARGKAKKSTTTIDLFIAVEEIFNYLDYEGAFEWDPDEEFEDDDFED